MDRNEAGQQISLRVNGQVRSVVVDPGRTLLSVLREDLGLTGSKRGCNQGTCGACTILADGRTRCSCLSLAVAMTDVEITTVEGLAHDGDLSEFQRAFIEHGAFQCGFCTAGMMLTAKSLLAESREPSVEEIRHGISGNLCRCTGYVKIIDAIRSISKRG